MVKVPVLQNLCTDQQQLFATVRMDSLWGVLCAQKNLLMACKKVLVVMFSSLSTWMADTAMQENMTTKALMS